MPAKRAGSFRHARKMVLQQLIAAVIVLMRHIHKTRSSFVCIIIMCKNFNFLPEIYQTNVLFVNGPVCKNLSNDSFLCDGIHNLSTFGASYELTSEVKQRCCICN